MIRLTIENCNLGLIEGPRKVLNQLYDEFEIKHPNAFQIMIRSRNNNWDGKVHFITENCRFKIGLLPIIYDRCIEIGQKVEVVDKRPSLGVKPVIQKTIGNKTLRPEQYDTLNRILTNKVGNVPFYIGVGDLAVNFGKSLLMASMYYAFKKKLRVLLLTNDSDWLNQAKNEFPELIPSEELTFVRGSNIFDWKPFTIAMVQSLSRNIRTYQRELSKIDMLLIDEADIIDNKTYTSVIKHLYNTRVRIGLSGTIYLSKLKKDLLHNMNVRSFIGNKIAEVKLSEMIEKGYSTKVSVRLIDTDWDFGGNNYPEEYQNNVLNKKSYNLSYKRAKININKGRLPMIIVTKFISHCEELYKYYKNKLGDAYTIAYVHHNIKDRKEILERFRDGKIDILISTTIISRGKNFPLLRYLQNAASMDSNEKAIQILGRLVRTHESKKKAYFDDIQYNGKYLSKHAKHRARYFKNENLKVIQVSSTKV